MRYAFIMIPDPLHHLERTTERMNEFMHARHHTAFSKYPLLFALLGAFGVVAVMYGLENMLGQIRVVKEYPVLSFLAGVAILLFTGSLYKRIDKKLD